MVLSGINAHLDTQNQHFRYKYKNLFEKKTSEYEQS